MCGTDIAAWCGPATGADPGGITVFAIFFPDKERSAGVWAQMISAAIRA